MRPVFEQRSLDPEHPLEIRDAEPFPQTTPEHQVLGTRDGARRVHLDHAELVHDAGDRLRPRGRQELPHDREATCLVQIELKMRPGHVT